MAKPKQVKEEQLSSNFKFVQRVIKRLVTGTPKSYPHQVKLCKILLDDYNNKKFWLWIKPPREIDSLLYFMSDWGRKWLSTQYLFYTQPEPVIEKPPVLGEKCEENIVIKKTPKTVADFLRS
jgi:hypothetical protein